MPTLNICLDENEMFKYLRLAKENSFNIEINSDLLKKNPNIFTEFKIGVHGTVGLSFNEMIKELKFLSRFSILYVIYHDSDFLRFLNDNLEELNMFDFPILVENYSEKSSSKFQNLYNSLKKRVKKIEKCIDFGHIILSNDKDIYKWVDKDVFVAHINNNFGMDTHNSLYFGRIDFLKVNRFLKKFEYVSLEVDKKFNTYLKNIKYMIKHQIIPFLDYETGLNHSLIQEEFIKELKKILKETFGENLNYSFIYGSFSKQKLTKKSDIDLLIVLKREQETKKFYNLYSKTCFKYRITLDQEYPYEIVTNKSLKCFFQKNHKTLKKRFIDDKGEILFAFLDKHRFITGNKKNYFLDCKKVFYMLLEGELPKKDKNTLKKIVKSFIISGFLKKDNNNILSETYQRYYSNLLVDLDKEYKKNLHPHYLLVSKKTNLSKKTKEEINNLEEVKTNNSIYFSNHLIRNKLTYLRDINFSELLDNLPFITSTNAFLETSKKFRLLFNEKNIFVICELKNPEIYFSNMEKIREVIKDLDKFLISSDFVFLCENNRKYLITPYYGKTFEDAVKEGLVDKNKRKEITYHLSKLYKKLNENGFLFGGFAPRNFLLHQDKIFIIDFEKLYRIDSIKEEEIDYIQNFQEIWFSDILSKKEIKEIFYPKKNIGLADYKEIEADEIECAYFRKNEITKKEREILFNFTKNVERLIIFRGKFIYGHNIGQFFTDNFSPELEAKIISNLYNLWKINKDYFKEIMHLFDFLIDFYNENNFRKIYGVNIKFNLSSLCSVVSVILKKLEEGSTGIINYLIWLLKNMPYTKRLPFVDRHKLIVKIKRDIEKSKILHRSDFSKVIKFSDIVIKEVIEPWNVEADKILLVNKIFNDSPTAISIVKSKKLSTIIYPYYGKNRLSNKDSAICAKLLAKLHKIYLNFDDKIDINSEYLNFNKDNINKLIFFLIKNGYDSKEVNLLKNEIKKIKNIKHPKCIIHNDLYYDQFHKDGKGKIRLLDWTYASVGSPFVDLSSILRNDYDKRNYGVDKNFFLKSYLNNSIHSDNFSFKRLEEGFYINCLRDLLWFIKRVEFENDKDSETTRGWINDAFKDIINKRFNNFFKNIKKT